jgi:hypothetical protein
LLSCLLREFCYRFSKWLERSDATAATKDEKDY